MSEKWIEILTRKGDTIDSFNVEGQQGEFTPKANSKDEIEVILFSEYESLKTQNKSLLKALREAVSKLEFYSLLGCPINGDNDRIASMSGMDRDYFRGGKQAREYLNSETYLSITHLLTEDKK